MRKRLTMYFSFSKREYNGLMVMIVLIVIVTAFPTVYNWLWPGVDDFKAEDRAIAKLMLSNEPSGSADKGGDGKNRPSTISLKPVLFKFDPNNIGIADWQKLGLSEKQASSILKYRAKGGKFKQPEDLKKMYTISPAMYEKLVPYVHIEASLPYGDASGKESQQYGHIKQGHITRANSFPKSGYAAKYNYPMIEINSADTIMLDQIKGIGPAFAKRIVKYRERLGAFNRKEQLMEVFGLDSLKFEEIKGQITVNNRLIVKININTAEFNDLKNNPYLKYKQVNAIIQFRKQHGNYSNIADLNKVAILSAETIEKLAPYISFSHD